MIDPELLNLLACPLDPARPPLREEGDYLVCETCQKAFPIVEGIPQLTPEDAVDYPVKSKPAPNA